jgi:hypothetical protein
MERPKTNLHPLPTLVRDVASQLNWQSRGGVETPSIVLLPNQPTAKTTIESKDVACGSC